ncbi:MAG: hypothetical protein HXK10_07860, partial [Actinomyces sp.]|nr:hypothetical protein [Actinomyces sp.]
YQTVLADCHKRADAAAARGETAKRQHSAAQESVKKTKRQLEALKDSHAPSTNVTNAQNAYKQACANEKRAAGAMTGAASDIKKEQMIVDAVANATISKIDTAISSTNDNLIDKISQFIKNVGKALAEISNWVKTLKDLVNTLKDIIYKTAILIFQCLVTAILVLGVFLIGLVLYFLAPLLGIIICSIAVLILAITLAAMGEKALIAAHNTALDAVEREHGPANVHDGDNGETTETVNTRPGKEGLIRDKMDLAGRPHPRGDWKEPPGWHEVGPEELRKLGIDPALLEDKRTGFHATLFRDDNGRYVLSYEGTNVHDFGGDVLTDVKGAVATSPQVHQAIQAATTVKQRLMANGVTAGNFSLTGHSLGGELAAAGSIATGAKATTFNAAGLSYTSMTLARESAIQNGFFTSDLDARARVENYSYSKDPLTNIQKITTAPEAFGKQFRIEAPPSEDASGEQRHGLDAMKRQYDAEHGHAYGHRQVPVKK